MQSKGYFSILFVILALIGISWEHTSKPNQEVVVQFDSEDVSCDETQNTIALVKLQLQEIGVENIQVVEEADGRLKITYYSNVDVAVVKSIISNGEKFSPSDISLFENEDQSELPTNNDSVSYELNVSELEQSLDFDLGANGYIPELKSNHNQYFTSIVSYANSEINFRSNNLIERVAYSLHRKTALLIDNSSHNIPEVRAGPDPHGIF